MNNKDKVFEYLNSRVEPQAVQTIQKGTGISHWNATLSICLELYISGRIKGIKTSKSWVFWIEKKGKAARAGDETLVQA